jgi:hypothetical protein
MNIKKYKYKGKDVYLQKKFKGLNFVLVSFSKDGRGLFKISSK